MKIIFFAILILFTADYGIYAQSTKPKSVKLEAYKRIDEPARDEVSGIIKSIKFEDTYWVHGDSGTKDRIYAINKKGETKSGKKSDNGVKIKGVTNNDWEDISLGENGTLIVADIGNNCHCRTDLSLILVNEPTPGDKEVEVLKKYRVEYPKENGVRSLLIDYSYNAEALFYKNGKIYIITKKEKGESVKLFRLDNPSESKVNELTFVSELPFSEVVTASDISLVHNKLAILTYGSIIVFDIARKDSDFFKGQSYRLVIKGTKQVESITFSDDNLIVTEEEGEMYEIALKDIPTHKFKKK